MLYENPLMDKTKERLEDLRKERKLSFEQLSKQLAKRGVNISHTNLRNYEINDPLHPLYNRTRSMSIEYLVAFADFYDVSVDYLLGLTDVRKREYQSASEQLGLCEGAIRVLMECKEESVNSEEHPRSYTQQDTVILDDFLTSLEFQIIMGHIKESLISYWLYERSLSDTTAKIRIRDEEKIEKAMRTLRTNGYEVVNHDVIAALYVNDAASEFKNYLRKLPKRLYEENVKPSRA